MLTKGMLLTVTVLAASVGVAHATASLPGPQTAQTFPWPGQQADALHIRYTPPAQHARLFPSRVNVHLHVTTKHGVTHGFIIVDLELELTHSDVLPSDWRQHIHCPADFGGASTYMLSFTSRNQPLLTVGADFAGCRSIHVLYGPLAGQDLGVSPGFWALLADALHRSRQSLFLRGSPPA